MMAAKAANRVARQAVRVLVRTVAPHGVRASLSRAAKARPKAPLKDGRRTGPKANALKVAVAAQPSAVVDGVKSAAKAAPNGLRHAGKAAPAAMMSAAKSALPARAVPMAQEKISAKGHRVVIFLKGVKRAI